MEYWLEKFMKILNINKIGFGILILLIFIVSYFNRWIFVFKFEPEYWENYYYTSQWNIPNSKRVISDEGVYRYIGYRLVNGENPFNVDYWVPPMGKYWYGMGAKYLNNPYLISFGFYLLSVWIVWLLSKKWLILYLWTINPLIVEQIGQTMLDLPMTLFLLIHIYFLFKYEKSKSIKDLIWGGIFLGLMAGTKPMYFVPMIGLIDWWWILINTDKNKIKNIFLYLFWVVGGYVLAYTCYFIAHPNPIPWLRLHEKIINFQKGNGGSHDIFNIFKTIFLDKYKGFWVGGTLMTFTGWSVILPIGTILLFKSIFLKAKKYVYLSLLGIGYILMCLSIDFWPRYLVLLLPILILITGNFFNTKQWVLILILFSYIPWLWFNFFPNKINVLNDWNKLINNSQYRDAYRLLDSSSKNMINEEKWLEYWKYNQNGYMQKETILENNLWKIKLE